MANFGLVMFVLLCSLCALALAAPKTPVFGFGKRSALEDSIESGELYRTYKRPMGAKFNMGFGKRAANRQFTMGFGKRSGMEDFAAEQFDY